MLHLPLLMNEDNAPSLVTGDEKKGTRLRLAAKGLVLFGKGGEEGRGSGFFSGKKKERLHAPLFSTRGRSAGLEGSGLLVFLRRESREGETLEKRGEKEWLRCLRWV